MRSKKALRLGRTLLACAILSMSSLAASGSIGGLKGDIARSAFASDNSLGAQQDSYKTIGANQASVSFPDGLTHALQGSNRQMRHLALLHQELKIADVRVITDGLFHMSIQFDTGLIEAGSLDDETMFIAVIPARSESVYLEFPASAAHALTNRKKASEVLSKDQLSKLDNALSALKLDLGGFKDVEIRHINDDGLEGLIFAKSRGYTTLSSCNESACLAAIMALDVAIIVAVIVCTGSLGLGCLAGAGAVAGAISAVALACEGCGG